ncbi:MAG TPA: site-2 protease family protein [Balneolaceae bacterium]|nr:site-2 protease family protein [Balneolaceae bacterium]
MRKAFKAIRDFLLAALVGAAGMASYLLLRDYLGVEPPGWATAISVAIAALIISVAIHEVGHFIAGKVVGLKFIMLTVGPLKIQRRGSQTHIELNKHLNLGGGLTVMLPKTDRFNDSDMFWFIIGGPLGNIAISVLSIAAILTLLFLSPGYVESLTVYTLYTIGFVSLIIGLAALLPTKSNGFESDGTQLLDLKRGGDKALIKQKLMVLSIAAWNGTRPRDLDKDELLSLLQMTESSKSTTALSVRLISALYYLDRGEVDNAETALDYIIECLKEEGNVVLEGTIYSEKAFIAAAFRKNAETAREFLKKAKKRYAEAQTIARAEAALSVLTNNIEEARARANEGIAAADVSLSKGSAIFDKEMLNILKDGKLPEQKRFSN